MTTLEIEEERGLTVPDLYDFPKHPQLRQIGVMLIDPPKTVEDLIACGRPAIDAIIRAWEWLLKHLDREQASERWVIHTKIDLLYKIRAWVPGDEVTDDLTLAVDRTETFFHEGDEVEVHIQGRPYTGFVHMTRCPSATHVTVDVNFGPKRGWQCVVFETVSWDIRLASDVPKMDTNPVLGQLWRKKLKENHPFAEFAYFIPSGIHP